MRDDPLLRSARLVGLPTRPLVRSLALGALAALSALALAGFSAWLITRAWQMPPVLSVAIAVTSVRALGISRALFRYLERLATHDLALRVMATARSRIYAAIAGGTGSLAARIRPADVVARTGRDVDDMGESLVRAVVPIGAAAVSACATVVVFAVISPWTGLAVAGAWVAAAVVAPWCAVRGAALAERAAADARDEATALTMTLLWHAAELEIAGRREEVAALAAAAEERARRAADTGTRVRSWAAGVLPAVSGACVLVACLVGVAVAGSVDATTLGVLILLPLSAFETAAPLVDAARQLHRSRDAASRVLAVVDAAGEPTVVADVRPVERATPTVLVAEDLRWGHPGRLPSGPIAGGLTLVPGSRVAVVGPSGSGKTTLLATIAGLVPPVEGDMTVHDDDGPVDPGETIRWFASDAHVFATTVRENLLVALGDADEVRLWDVLRRVGLADWVRGLDGGLDHLLASGPDSMSTGQARRLLLARALICPVPVLLLDEPCENVDPDEADVLTAALLDRNSGLVEPDRAVVVVTHRLPRRCTADRVVDLTATTPVGSGASTCR
ncbi:thiol reductant ABC exporter subunit CydC [Williamsia serinedens]|uniref:ATP-binding cassette, subfamily C, CydC n=1 Tax=Williamsia serinedens TaxID=391736 RepID=A0ABT1H1X3_9NOCA|nr:thiol reductant ABC exporter subunit CydC [Williamsia serinedens]MCP2160989.1 ATP-binding cassette, subfamily C, CydC [Williamsia serinedens]